MSNGRKGEREGGRTKKGRKRTALDDEKYTDKKYNLEKSLTDSALGRAKLVSAYKGI